MKKILNLLHYSPNATRKMAILILLYTALVIFQIMQPEVLNRSVQAIESKNAAYLGQAMILACIALAGNLLIDVLAKLRLRKFSNDTLFSVQTDLLVRVMNFKRSHFLKHDPSSYLTGIVDFAEEAVKSSVDWFSESICGVVMLIVSVLYMSYLSVPLTAIVVCFNILLRLILRIAERQIKKNVESCNQIVKKNNGFLVETLENMMAIRVFQKGRYIQQKVAENEYNTYRSRVRSYAWNSGQSEFIWCTLKFAEYVLVYGVGGILLYHGLIDFGLLLAFPIAMDYFVKAINQLFYALIDKNTALTTISNLDFLYDVSETEEEMEAEPLKAKEIRLEHVSFGFESGDGVRREILKDVSFTVKPGEKVLLQGANGQGKSTLLYLISGQLRPDSGEIYYGDVPLSRRNLDAVSQSYGLITQEHNMLPCSVSQNVALDDKPDSSRCRGILERLKMGYAIDRKTALLSQGEKQRVNIARAFYKKQEGNIFLLGDEILSNIDAANADHVLAMIEEIFADDTVIMVCHGDTGFRWNKRITVGHGCAVVEEV